MKNPLLRLVKIGDVYSDEYFSDNDDLSHTIVVAIIPSNTVLVYCPGAEEPLQRRYIDYVYNRMGWLEKRYENW